LIIIIFCIQYAIVYINRTAGETNGCFLHLVGDCSLAEHENFPRFEAGDTIVGDNSVNSFIPVEKECVRVSTPTLPPCVCLTGVGD
jgi:hypothetical protein